MRVIPTFDPFEHSHLGFRLSFEPTAVQQFTFERGKEALGHCIVVRVAHGTHRGHDAGFSASLAKGVARVLAASIGVVDDCRRLPLCDRHVQRRQNQLRSQVRLHRPAHDATRVHIKHHRQIQKAGPSREWSERPGVVELFPGLSAPNQTCTLPRIRLSISSVAYSKYKISVTRFKDVGLLIT
jgi:hypothetical protein